MHSGVIMLQRDSREKRNLLSLCILRKQPFQCGAFCVASLIGASVGAAAATAAPHALHTMQRVSGLPALVGWDARHDPALCPAQRQLDNGRATEQCAGPHGLFAAVHLPNQFCDPTPCLWLDILLFTQLQTHANRMRAVLGSVCIQLLDDRCLLGCRAAQAATQVCNPLLLCCQPWLRPQLRQ